MTKKIVSVQLLLHSGKIGEVGGSAHRLKDEELTGLFISKFNVSDFSKSFFFSTNHSPKTWLEISKVKLYRNDLRGNRNYFQLTEDSSYREFGGY